MESNEVIDKPPSKGSVRRRTLSKTLKEPKLSLSTINEETKSKLNESPVKTNSSKSTLASKTGSPTPSPSPEFQSKSTSPRGSGGSRLREHSIILRHTSQEITLPRDLERSSSLQQRLLSHISYSNKPLFPTVFAEGAYKTPSILVKGFGLRNLSSLQQALNIEEEKKLKQLYQAEHKSSSSELSKTDIASTSHLGSSSETQTDQISSRSDGKKKVMYLLGLEMDQEEEEIANLEGFGEEEEESFEFEVMGKKSVTSSLTTLAMRNAQKYLRVHRVFELFRFITAHLLSALPENPIEFIIELLDQALIYRSGLGDPPLLYNRNHLECLFNLMDKMRTGVIDVDQYKTGMRTIGVCSFNETPPTDADGMVKKEDFIEEAYDRLSCLLSDVLKRRWINGRPPTPPPAPPTPQISPVSTTTSGEYESPKFTRTHYFIS